MEVVWDFLVGFKEATEAGFLRLESEMKSGTTRLDQRMNGIERRLEGVEYRLDGVERRLTRIEDRLSDVEVRDIPEN